MQQSITKGSAPSHSVAVNGLTNQIIGQSFHLNGNLGKASHYGLSVPLQPVAITHAPDGLSCVVEVVMDLPISPPP